MYSPSIGEDLYTHDQYGQFQSAPFGVDQHYHIFKENKLKLTKHTGHLPSFAAAVGAGLHQQTQEQPVPIVKAEPFVANIKKRRVEEVINMMCQSRLDTSTHPTGLYESTGVTKPVVSKPSHSNGDYSITLGECFSSSTEIYEVTAFLGRGTFGQVVKCRCRSNGNMAAVKILKNHPSYLRQGNVEIQILQTLNREDTEASNIVRAIECFEHNKHMCLVFELLEQNLYEYLKVNKFRPMAVSDIRQITQQVLLALAKLKSLGLIHADLKPENIMLVDSTNGFTGFRVKVIDFGSACQSAKAVQNTYLQSRYYRAPEILLGLPFNEAIDMWSLGCVIAELFLGWPLYPGASEYDQMRYIVDTQGLPPSDLINRASKSGRFFVCDSFTCSWRLRTSDEVNNNTVTSSNTAAEPSSNHTAAVRTAKEPRKYIFTSLDQIAMATTGSSGGAGEYELDARRQMAALLVLMLQWNGAERVLPSMALRHPFITAAYTIKCVPEQACMTNTIAQGNNGPPPHTFSLYGPGALGPLTADPVREMVQQQPSSNPSLSMGGHFQNVGSGFDPTVGSLPSQSAAHYLSQQDPNLLMLQHVISPATALAIRSLIPGIDTCGGNRQGFVPPSALAHSLLMSASEGVPLPPSDPWRDSTRASQPPDPWALALAAAALGRHYYASLPTDLLFRQQQASVSAPQIADMAPSTPLHQQFTNGCGGGFQSAAMGNGYLQHNNHQSQQNQMAPPSLHPAPGVVNNNPMQQYQQQHQQQVGGFHREMSCPSNMGSLGSASFPIYVSSSESDGSPMDSNSVMHGLAMNQMGQIGNPDIWEMKDKKSIPVGRVQPILKGPPVPSPQCPQFDAYQSMFMRQPMARLQHTGPAAHYLHQVTSQQHQQQQNGYFQQQQNCGDPRFMTEHNLVASAMLDPYMVAYGTGALM